MKKEKIHQQMLKGTLKSDKTPNKCKMMQSRQICQQKMEEEAEGKAD